MGATCIGLCRRMKMPKPKKIGGFYRNGYKRCSYCEWYAKPEVLKKQGYDDRKCPCCRRIFKTRPNSKAFREKYDERK